MKMNPWIKVGYCLAVGIRLGQYAMAAVETVAGRWLRKKADELKPVTQEENKETE